MIEKTIYFSVAMSFFAARLFSLNLGYFQLSPFRLSILFLMLYVILTSLKSPSSTKIIPKSDNRYSVNFMLFWLSYSLISIIWVKDYTSAIRDIYFIFSGVICAVVFSMYLKSKRQFWIVFNIMQMMVIFHNIVGWYEVITRDYRFISKENLLFYSTTDQRIPISLLGNPNDFATLALLGLSVALTCLHINKSIWFKLLSILLIFSNVFLIVLSLSRANILGMFVLFALYLLLSRKTRVRVMVGVGLIICAFIFAFSPSTYNDVIYFLSKLFSFNVSTHTWYLNSESVRINLIRNGLFFLMKTFGLGTGVGNITYWMNNYALYYTAGVTNIHNWWFEILTGYGVFVFIFYIIFYFNIFKDTINIYKNTESDFDKNIAFGILLFMTAFIIASISSSSNISNEWLWVYWGTVIAFQGYALDNIRFKVKKLKDNLNNMK